jgi:urease accessory protein
VTIRIARTLHRRGSWSGPPSARLTLDCEGRLLRRRALTTTDGRALLIDLPETVSLDGGDALETETGGLVEIVAAREPLCAVTAPAHELIRLAWHLGNRHAPAQLEPGRILLRRDRVLRDMLVRLGAEVRDVVEPFTPEGGACGHVRACQHGHDPLADPNAPPDRDLEPPPAAGDG